MQRGHSHFLGEILVAMITEYFEVGDNKWGVLLCYGYGRRDLRDMWAIMRSFGISDDDAERSLDILSHLDTGMTISNDDIRMSVIFISDASSEVEWWNTLAHELYHVNNAIIDYYGEAWDGEPPAYLQGYLFRKIMDRIGVCE